MRNLKISIIGNSVGLRVRPPLPYPNNKNYGLILEELLQQEYPERIVFVNNLCVGRATIWDVLEKRNEILNEFPHYYIINLGVSDASTREIPLWYSNIITSRKEFLLKWILLLLYYSVIRKFRPTFVKLRGKRGWTSARKFKKYLSKLIYLLRKDTNSQIILLSINTLSERIEKELPGSAERYIVFNKIIKELSVKYNTLFLDTTNLCQNKYLPDGIHFSIDGNKEIARQLLNLIKDNEKRLCNPLCVNVSDTLTPC